LGGCFREVIDIRAATPGDVPAIAALFHEHMRAAFGPDAVWDGSPEALARDGFGLHFQMLVATRAGECVGFVGWQNDYDVHSCLPGGELNDLYVRPDVRGLGVALRLVAAVAATVRARGGKYIRGLTTGDPRTLALYGRVAVAFEGANCVLGGAAFRTVADLAGKPARAIIRGLPDKSTNFDA